MDLYNVACGKPEKKGESSFFEEGRRIILTIKKSINLRLDSDVSVML